MSQGGGGGGGGGAKVEGEGEERRLRNIRGFLFKRRKSPLKGWHKVCVNVCSVYSRCIVVHSEDPVLSFLCKQAC